MARGHRMAKPAKVLLNVPAIKADFPILQRTVRDKRLVYLDSAATSQKPKQVIDATSDFYSRYNANVHRAIYELREEATREYEGSREKIAAFIQAKSPTEIAFTKSTTESLNLVAYGYGLKGKLQKGDEIVGTVMEHHSNHVPWHFVKDHKGAVLKYVDVNDDGTLRMEQYDDLLTNRTKIVTVTLCSNVLGTINPVKEIAKRAHEVGAICVVDVAQAAPHMPIDVQALDADFLAFTIAGAHPHDSAWILGVEGICVRPGHHCAQPLMERFNRPATARASFYIYSDMADADALVAGINKVQEVFA